MYGPYIRVASGRYTVCLEGLLDPVGLEMYVETVANAGDLTVARFAVSKSVERLEMVFDLESDVNDLEIRLFCTEGGSVRIDSLSLMPVLS